MFPRRETVLNSIHIFLTQFTDEAIAISSLILLLVGMLFVAFWIYNRRKFHRLSHQIPASVVKNYLDSIIQNSTALKSSLFRGGGLELGNGIPSVVPVADLASTTIGVASEDLAQKNAEIALLNSRILEKDTIISDLEKKLKDGASSAKNSVSNEEVNALKKKLEEAEKALKGAQSKGGDTAAIEAKLAEVTRERDQLQERLMEYEIIEEDLANLKRLQQENEQLRKSLTAAGAGGVAAVAAEVTVDSEASGPGPVENKIEGAPIPSPDDDIASSMTDSEEIPKEEEVVAVEENVEASKQQEVAEEESKGAEDVLEQAPEVSNNVEEPAQASEAASADENASSPPPQTAASGDSKTAEELLSEFEKMLG